MNHEISIRMGLLGFTPGVLFGSRARAREEIFVQVGGGDVGRR